MAIKSLAWLDDPSGFRKTSVESGVVSSMVVFILSLFFSQCNGQSRWTLRVTLKVQQAKVNGVIGERNVRYGLAMRATECLLYYDNQGRKDVRAIRSRVFVEIIISFVELSLMG
jgi:hypothetical protein